MQDNTTEKSGMAVAQALNGVTPTPAPEAQKKGVLDSLFKAFTFQSSDKPANAEPRPLVGADEVKAVAPEHVQEYKPDTSGPQLVTEPVPSETPNQTAPTTATIEPILETQHEDHIDEMPSAQAAREMLTTTEPASADNSTSTTETPTAEAAPSVPTATMGWPEQHIPSSNLEQSQSIAEPAAEAPAVQSTTPMFQTVEVAGQSQQTETPTSTDTSAPATESEIGSEPIPFGLKVDPVKPFDYPEPATEGAPEPSTVASAETTSTAESTAPGIISNAEALAPATAEVPTKTPTTASGTIGMEPSAEVPAVVATQETSINPADQLTAQQNTTGIGETTEEQLDQNDNPLETIIKYG